MDVGKRKTLIEWVNSLAVAECIESLDQLKDGRHLLALANLVEGIPQQSDIETQEKRWDLIFTYLEGLYQCGMNTKVEKKAILGESHEFEIAKATLLLMSAAMLCERNSVFVERAMQMEVSLQHEIREMVEWVIQPNQNLADLDPCYHQVLCKSLEETSAPITPNWRELCLVDMRNLNPQASSTPQSCAQRSRYPSRSAATPDMALRGPKDGIGNTPVFSTSILGRFTSPGPSCAMSPMSPVQQMVQSPNMANKIRIQQKEQKIKLLERDLNTKRHLLGEYEAEMEDARKELDNKDKSLAKANEQLHEAVRKLRQMECEIEDLRDSQDLQDQEMPDVDRLHQFRREVASLTERNKQLEQENTELFAKVHPLEDQVGQMEKLREQLRAYQARLRDSERELCELRSAVSEKTQQVGRLSEVTEQAHSELMSLRQHHHQQVAVLQAQLDGSAVMGGGESLGGVMEIKYKEELEALKNEIAEYDQKLQEKASHVLELLSIKEQMTIEQSELTYTNGQLSQQVEELSKVLEKTQQDLSQSLETSGLWERKAHELESSLGEVRNTSQAQIADLEARIVAEQAEKQRQLTSAQEAINNLQTAMDSTQAAFAQEKETLSTQIQSSEEKIEQLLSDLKNEGEKNNMLSEQISTKQIEVEELTANLNATQQQLTLVQENMNQQLQQKDACITEIEVALSSKTEELQKTTKSFQNKIQEKETQLKNLQEHIQSVEEKLASAQSELEITLQQMALVQDSMTQQLQQKDAHTQDIEMTLSSKVEELQQTVTELKKEILDKENQVKVQQEQLHAIKEQLESTTTELNNTHQQLTEQLQQKDAHIQDIEITLSSKAEELQQTAETYQKETLEKENHLKSQQECIQSLNEQLNSTQKDLTSQLEQKDTAISELTQELHSLRMESSCMQEQKSQLEGILAAAKQESAEAETRCAKLEEVLKQHEAAAEDHKKELARQLEMATMSGDEQRETVQRISLQLQEVSANHEEAQRALEAMRAEQADKEEQWHVKVDEFEKAAGEIVILRQQQQETEVELRQVGSQLDQALTQLEETKATRDAFMVRVQEQEANVAELNERLLESETQIEEEKTKFVNLERDMKKTKEEMSHMRQELDAECERVEAMETELMETQQVAENKEAELNAKLEEAWLARESLENEMCAVRSKTRVMEDQGELLHQKLCQMAECLKQSKEEAEHRVEGLQKKLAMVEENRKLVIEELDDAQFKITTLQEELQESKEHSDVLECNILHHQNHAETIEARLKEFMEEKEGETGTLVTELTDSDNKLKETRTQLAEKITELAAMSAELVQIREQSSQMETNFNSQLQVAQTNIQTLQQQLEAEAAKTTSAEESLKMAQETLFCTEQQREEAQQSLLQSRMSLSGKEDHLGALQEKVAMLKGELEASNARVQELQETVFIHEQKSSDLQKQHQDSEAEAERKEMKLEAEIERMEEENEEMHNRITLLEREKQVLLERSNQEELAVKEARLNAVSLEQELTTTRRELTMRQEALQNMEVQGMNQIGNLEKVLNETSAKSNAICMEYEQKIAHLQQEAIAACQKYESQIQELHTALQQTKGVVEDRERSHQQEVAKLGREQKEEVKVLARQIESLTTELQSLKCWELSERASVKELEEKCGNLEKKLSESNHAKMVLSLKVQSMEKQLAELEGDMTGEKADLSAQLTAVTHLETELRSELEDMKSQLLQAKNQYTEELKKLNEERAETQNQLQEIAEALSKAQAELQEAHEELDAANRHHEEELIELEERCKQMEEYMEKQVQRSSESTFKEQKLVHKHEEELAHLRDEHFANMAEIEMNYTLEIERLEAELLAVKNDVTHTQELLAAVENKAAAAQNDAHAEMLSLEKDKLDLESQLESRDRQLKAAKAESDRAMRLKVLKELEKTELQQENQQLQREMHKLIEREKRHLAAHRHEMSLGADMNAKLQQVGAEKEAELRATQEQYQDEIKELAAQLGSMQEKYKAELELLEGKNDEFLDEQISEWRSKFEQLTVAFNKLEDRHAKSEAERQKLETGIREAEAERAAVQEREARLAETVTEVTAQRDRCEEQLQEASNLQNQLREEEMLNKRLGNQVRSLEAQLDHASRQLKAEGRPRTLVPPPQPPPFPETPASLRRSMRLAKENTPEAKQPAKTSSLSPKSSSDDEFTKPYDLRSAKNSDGVLSLKDLTVTPGTEGRYLSRLSISNSFGPTPKRSRSSLSSYSEARDSAKSDRSERSEQARSMRLSISSTSSHESTRSANVPFGTGALFSMEDEPVEFEWDRLSELQRRNTLCLPHLKSSYPAEVQTVKPKQISERDLQKGEPLNESQDEGMETRSRKRTSTDRLNDENPGNRRKTFAAGTLRPGASSTSTLNGSSGVTLKVYPHYSPRAGGTPKHKLARTSPRGTPTSASKKKRGEERSTPKSATPKRNTPTVKTPKQKTPKKPRGRFGSTPKVKPSTPKTQTKKENADPKSKVLKTPMSFNIGFTPKKSRRLTQFLRKKKPAGDIETPKVKGKKPLGDHNRP